MLDDISGQIPLNASPLRLLLRSSIREKSHPIFYPTLSTSYCSGWKEIDTTINAGEAKTLPTEMRLGSYCNPGDGTPTFPILPNSPRQAQ